MLSANDIFERATQDPVKDLIQTPTSKLRFIPWMDAHLRFAALFPDYEYEYLTNAEGQSCFYFADGTAEVRCKMTVGQLTRTVSLPIHRNGKAIQNPNAFDINTAKQRCRVKAYADFGWGSRLWTDDLDEDEREVLPAVDESFPFAQPAAAEADQRGVAKADQRDELWASLGFPKKTAAANKKLIEQYQNALRTRGLEDDSKTRVAAVRS